MLRAVLAVFCLCAVISFKSIDLTGQTPAAVSLPRVELRSATPLQLPGEVDSNSPAVWDRVGGERRLFVMTSVNGRPSIASGPALNRLGRPVPVALEPWPEGGVWME